MGSVVSQLICGVRCINNGVRQSELVTLSSCQPEASLWEGKEQYTGSQNERKHFGQILKHPQLYVAGVPVD